MHRLAGVEEVEVEVEAWLFEAGVEVAQVRCGEEFNGNELERTGLPFYLCSDPWNSPPAHWLHAKARFVRLRPSTPSRPTYASSHSVKNSSTLKTTFDGQRNGDNYK